MAKPTSFDLQVVTIFLLVVIALFIAAMSSGIIAHLNRLEAYHAFEGLTIPPQKDDASSDQRSI